MGWKYELAIWIKTTPEGPFSYQTVFKGNTIVALISAWWKSRNYKKGHARRIIIR